MMSICCHEDCPIATPLRQSLPNVIAREDAFSDRGNLLLAGLFRMEGLLLTCLKIASPHRVRNDTRQIVIAREDAFSDRGNLLLAGLFRMEWTTPHLLEDCFTPLGFAMTIGHIMFSRKSVIFSNPYSELADLREQQSEMVSRCCLE
jgi:hypothetical protein